MRQRLKRFLDRPNVVEYGTVIVLLILTIIGTAAWTESITPRQDAYCPMHISRVVLCTPRNTTK